jgi:signal peptidase I
MDNRSREPLLGLLLTIVLPGLGHVYAKQLLRAIVAFVVVIAPAAGLVWYFVQPGVKISPFWFIPFLVPFAAQVLVAADAYRQVVKFNRSHQYVRTLSPWIMALLGCGIVSAVIAVNFAYVGISFILNSFVMPYRTPPNSMAPTIYENERVFIDLNAYKRSGPSRGSVILYRSPEIRGRVYIHRVMGLPGESVELKDHRVVINGKPLKEPWCERIRYYNRGKFGQKKKPVTVPKDSYFVVGDASASSNDSRFWGFVPKANLIGRVFKIYYPYDRSGPVH